MAAWIVLLAAALLPSAEDPPPRAAPSFLARGTEAIGPHPDRARSGRWQVSAGPVSEIEPGLAGRSAELLAAFEEAYREFWSDLPLPPGGESGEPVEVLLFSSPARLKAALAGVGAAAPAFEAGGVHLPRERMVAVAVESRLERVLQASLVHEATHLLNAEILGGDRTMPWFNEGLAQFCQYSEITPEGEIRLGRLDRGSALRIPDAGGTVTYQFVPHRSLSYMMGQFRRNPGLSLGPTLEIGSRERFYGEGAQRRYAESWTLIHLLAEGRIRKVGPLRPLLGRYARMERAGEGGRQALLDLLGIPMEDLDDAWYRHVKKLH